MIHKYDGEFTDTQMSVTLRNLQKQIFFLLLIVDPKTNENYQNVDVNAAFTDLQRKLAGMNSLLSEPPSLVIVMSLLERALIEYNSPDFQFSVFRKLVLDAGSKIKEV